MPLMWELYTSWPFRPGRGPRGGPLLYVGVPGLTAGGSSRFARLAHPAPGPAALVWTPCEERGSQRGPVPAPPSGHLPPEKIPLPQSRIFPDQPPRCAQRLIPLHGPAPLPQRRAQPPPFPRCRSALLPLAGGWSRRSAALPGRLGSGRRPVGRARFGSARAGSRGGAGAGGRRHGLEGRGRR